MPSNKPNYNPCESLNMRSRTYHQGKSVFFNSNPNAKRQDERRKLISSNYHTSPACNIEREHSMQKQRRLHKKVKLTKREKECLEWASQGKTSFEIGTILGLSENTINNYIASIVRKMGASNRLHMVGIALRENYID